MLAAAAHAALPRWRVGEAKRWRGSERWRGRMEGYIVMTGIGGHALRQMRNGLPALLLVASACIEGAGGWAGSGH